MDRTIIGSFNYKSGAENAAFNFKSQGLNMDDVSILTKDYTQMDYMPEFTGFFSRVNTMESVSRMFSDAGNYFMPGLGVVNAFGTVSEQLRADKPPTVLGSLSDMGIPTDVCQQFEEDLRTGKIIVTFRSDEKSVMEAAHILRQSGAHAINVF